MNEQNDPFITICEALALNLMQQVTSLKSAEAGWPDARWRKVDNNMPAVFFVQVSETSRNVVSRHKVHKTIDNGDGTGIIFTEQLRISMLIQLSLFTNDINDRDSLGWEIKQFLVTNYRLPLADGEYAMFKSKGDHSNPGETKFYQRDLTFEATARVLDATTATKVITLNPTNDINTTMDTE